MNHGNGVRLQFNEVATRDGFQMECHFIETNDKVALLDALSGLGFAKIEVTSFTSPKAIPALKDAEAVMHRIRRTPGVVYTALVPNVRGGERALACATDEFNLVMSVSATHNLANLRMTQEQSFSQLQDVIALGTQHGVPVNVSLSCVFGCPMEGEIAAEAVLGWIARFAALGVHGITLCDTTGMAFPNQVQALCEAVQARFPKLEFTAHFHNTRGMGLVNAVAAAQAGIRRFDTSLGGIGGCPYAPGATGNVATEDMVHMFDCMGYDTGMHLPGLLDAAATLRRLLRHDLPAQVSQAGPRLTRHAPPADFEAIRQAALAR
ncbi:hydroxymethylglutaryl-CoA lyase [Cupriavidus sp. CuC1]|uniref:hydroxymethylglutaryl-CoA lyase n=1 Tax=Cupriavidus sp. CuC1 TaxID=3373131 RepID=UPI0037D6CB1A